MSRILTQLSPPPKWTNTVLLALFVSLSILPQFGCSTFTPIPDVAQAYAKRGQTKLIIDKDYGGAIEDFTQAIEFNYNDSYSYLGRGLAYKKLGNIDAAQEDIKKAISINPALAPLEDAFE